MPTVVFAKLPIKIKPVLNIIYKFESFGVF